MNEKQAHLIQLRFYNNNKKGEFCELARCFPKFIIALMMLPDMSGLKYCNVMLHDMVMGEMKRFGFDN